MSSAVEAAVVTGGFTFGGVLTYVGGGCDWRDVGSMHSFDRLLRKGPDGVHVEVKDKTEAAETVALNGNEVTRAATGQLDLA